MAASPAPTAAAPAAVDAPPAGLGAVAAADTASAAHAAEAADVPPPLETAATAAAATDPTSSAAAAAAAAGGPPKRMPSALKRRRHRSGIIASDAARFKAAMAAEGLLDSSATAAGEPAAAGNPGSGTATRPPTATVARRHKSGIAVGSAAGAPGGGEVPSAAEGEDRARAATGVSRRKSTARSKDQTVEVARVPPCESLEELLSYKSGAVIFSQFLSSIGVSDDPIVFWFACKEYREKASLDRDIRRIEARRIYDTFLRPGALNLIKVKDVALVARMESQLLWPSLLIFDQVAQEVLATLQEEVYPIFLKSQLYDVVTDPVRTPADGALLGAPRCLTQRPPCALRCVCGGCTEPAAQAVHLAQRAEPPPHAVREPQAHHDRRRARQGVARGRGRAGRADHAGRDHHRARPVPADAPPHPERARRDRPRGPARAGAARAARQGHAAARGPRRRARLGDPDPAVDHHHVVLAAGLHSRRGLGHAVVGGGAAHAAEWAPAVQHRHCAPGVAELGVVGVGVGDGQAHQHRAPGERGHRGHHPVVRGHGGGERRHAAQREHRHGDGPLGARGLALRPAAAAADPADGPLPPPLCAAGCRL